jgi:hypothetical protein
MTLTATPRGARSPASESVNASTAPVDILRAGYVKAHCLNVLDRRKGLQIGLLALAGIDEVAVGRQLLGDLAGQCRYWRR